jgi:hypothetical protein
MKSSSRRWALLVLVCLLAGLSTLSLVGCGKKEQVDPYVYASLRQVMTGAVLDTVGRQFNFEIDAPKFEYVKGNVGIIREGNRLEFLVADNLEKRQNELGGALLGVKMTFTPAPTHLVLERIKRGGAVVADSLPKPQNYALPTVLRANQVDTSLPGAPLPEIKWERTETVQPYLPQNKGDDLIAIQTAVERFVRAPRHDLTDAQRANPSDKDMGWYAVFPNATVQIVNVTPGADYMLQLLLKQDLPLVGSFSMKTLSDFVDRKTVNGSLGHVVGTMRINWFRYANAFIEGSKQS